MATNGEYRVLAGAILGSFVVHVLLAIVAPRMPRDELRPTVVPPSLVELEVMAPPPAPAVDPVRQPERPTVRAPQGLAVTNPAAPAPSTNAPQPEVAPEVAAPAEPEPPVVAETQPAAPTPTVAMLPATERRALSLDPRAVALAALPLEMGRPVAPAVPAGGAGGDATTDRERSAMLTRELRADANARAYLSRRPPPELRRRSDGSYEFRGPVFGAVIAPDGTVAFSDRGNVGADRFGSSGGVGLSGHFDLNDAMHRRHGSDPYSAERRWFLGETEELRTRLADGFRSSRATASARTVRGRLQRIWDDASRTPEQRRSAIFRVWDDCAEDETGEAVRAAVVGFVRDRLPSGTSDAFTGAELARLNARRESSVAFEPYRATGAND